MSKNETTRERISRLESQIGPSYQEEFGDKREAKWREMCSSPENWNRAWENLKAAAKRRVNANKDIEIGTVPGRMDVVAFCIRRDRDQVLGIDITNINSIYDINMAVLNDCSFYIDETDVDVNYRDSGMLPKELYGAVRWQVAKEGMNGIAIVGYSR